MFNSTKQTGKRIYVRIAQVEDDKQLTKPEITDEYGRFSLTYVGFSNDKTVNFQVSKTGLKVVDLTALHAVPGQFDTVRISIANPDSLADYRFRIFEIGETSAYRSLKNKLNDLNRQLAESKKNSQTNNVLIELREQMRIRFKSGFR